jgi:hypothetical protein
MLSLFLNGIVDPKTAKLVEGSVGDRTVSLDSMSWGCLGIWVGVMGVMANELLGE